MYVVAAVAGGSAASSVVVRPVQSSVQVNTTNSSVPVFCPPNFPTIHQALRGTADQPVSIATSSTVTTATVSMAPDPAVVKTLLASKLVRNMSHVTSCEAASTTNITTTSVPSSSSVGCDSENHVDVSGVAGEEMTTVSTSCPPVTVSSSSSSSLSSLCLANGHAKQTHDPPTTLTNGICSPVPSCSSEDQEPAVAVPDMKVAGKSGYSVGECDGVVVNGDVIDDNDDDDDDDASVLNECDDGDDVLVKAMMHADIIDCGGRPALTADSCDDDDSHLSADFVTGFIESTGERVSSAAVDTREQLMSSEELVSGRGPEADGGFDSETAAAVADLLHETSLMDETETATMTTTGNDEYLSFDDGQDVIAPASPAATDDKQLTTSIVDVNSPSVVDVSSASSAEQSRPADDAATCCTSAGSHWPSSTAVTASTAALQNGVMVIPPHGLSLPSGQFISGGTRLLIRPVVSSSTPPSLSVRLTQPTLAPAVRAESASGGTVSSSSCSVTVSSSSTAAAGFISSATSQGQLIIQRAQILNSANSTMIQRVIVPPSAPRPIAMRSDGQTQPTQPLAGQHQPLGGRPLLLSQAPLTANQLGQLRVAAMTVGNAAQQTHAQIVLQSGHVISVQPPQPSTHASDHTTSNSPALAAKDYQANQSDSITSDPATSTHTAAAQLSTSLKPPGRPLISTSQQPIQIVGGSLQLRAGLVGLPAGSGNASVILQHGGQPILLQSSNVGTMQHPSSYVVFRPGPPLAVPSSQEHVGLSSVPLTTSSSIGSDITARKRPLPPSSAAVTRSMRKKTRRDEDGGSTFVCEWSGCHR